VYLLLNAEQVVNKTWAALLYLRDIFPLKKFNNQLPPIILRHQLYSVVMNRGLVDMQLVSSSRSFNFLIIFIIVIIVIVLDVFIFSF